MRKKCIVAFGGRANQGKSETIRNLIPLFQQYYPNALYSYIYKGADIKLIIEVNNKKIGIESQGDPNSRLAASLDDFARIEQCDIIICASRTRGETVHAVSRTASSFGYEVIWISNYISKNNQFTLNQMSANHIFQLIQSLI